MLKAALLALLSASWQWVLDKFGLSDAQKLIRAEDTNKQQAQTIQDVRLSNEVQQSVTDMHESDKRELLSRKWRD